ncbi:hypothetical protein [Actinoplanes sp. URMC 104]|uniref:hypothetical protein n=1 Tax=Actinoplanes sp. URMC 104 TaxID=3423409 RepID=UPI003F1CE19E
MEQLELLGAHLVGPGGRADVPPDVDVPEAQHRRGRRVRRIPGEHLADLILDVLHLGGRPQQHRAAGRRQPVGQPAGSVEVARGQQLPQHADLGVGVRRIEQDGVGLGHGGQHRRT